MDFERYELMDEVNKNGMALQFASVRLRDNESVVLTAVKQNGLALQYASIRLRNDPYLVMEAVEQNAWALQFATTRLRNDPRVVMLAVKQNGLALIFASDNLKYNLEVIEPAVTQNGYALKYAFKQNYPNKYSTIEYKKRERASLIAVYQNGMALQYSEFTSSKKVVTEAVLQNGLALAFASDVLKNDKEVVMIAVNQQSRSLQYASDALKNDKEVVVTAIRQHKRDSLDEFFPLDDDDDLVHFPVLNYASDALKNDKEVVMIAVKKEADENERYGDSPAYSFKYASNALKNDKSFVMELLKFKDCIVLPFVSDELKNDKEVVIESLKINGTFINHASERLQNDKEVVMVAVNSETNDYVLQYVLDKFKNDKEVVIASINTSFMQIQFASETLKADPDIACFAIKKYKEYFTKEIYSNSHPEEMEPEERVSLLKKILSYIDSSLDENDQFIQCMIDQKIPPIGRERLKSHMMDRIKFQTMKTKVPFTRTRTNKLISSFLGGTRKKFTSGV